jgi:hypothetical protein
MREPKKPRWGQALPSEARNSDAVCDRSKLSSTGMRHVSTEWLMRKIFGPVRGRGERNSELLEAGAASGSSDMG